MYITHGMLVNEEIRNHKVMTDNDFFAAEITEWLTSKERAEQVNAEKYYMGEHDILNRKREIVDSNGRKLELKNAPNHKVVDNLYSLMVDQRKNYILSRPITYKTDNDDYSTVLKTLFTKKFQKVIQSCGHEAINGGICFLYPYIDKNSKLKWRIFPGYECKPFWKDKEHTELEKLLRYYTVEYYDENKKKKFLELVEEYSEEGVTVYRYSEGTLYLEHELQPYLKIEDIGFNWGKIPLIPIKGNTKEIPLIKRTKELQDAINLIYSNFVNQFDENPGSSILVLHNYDGTNLDQFKKNLATYGVIKVRSEDGAQGGVETLNIQIDSANYKTILEELKKSLIENARGFDAKDDRLNGTPNQLNIRSMYSEIDLASDEFEVELQMAFEEILEFFNIYNQWRNGQGYDEEEVEIVFNRDILINETEAIQNCRNSEGIISRDTIVSMHPWTGNPQDELEKLEEEKEDQISMYDNSYTTAFSTQTETEI